MNFLLSFIASILHVLFLASPSDSYWARLVLFFVRLFTLSILSRNFLLPWLLSILSKRMRVKSISLTSIRGLYIRTGSQIIRVDRISWSWLHVNGVHVKLQGLNIEVRKAEPPPTAPPARRGNRNLTLADLAPSSFVQRLFAWIYSTMEPFVRPVIRVLAVTCLRGLIRWLPNIISNITFDLSDTSLALPDLLDASISIQGITFHTELKFTQLGNVPDNVEETSQRPSRRRRLLAMSAWRKRFEDGFQRALDRAWGKAHGTAAVDFQIHGVAGTFEKRSEAPFLKFPGAVSLAASMKFSPREASIDTNSLAMNLDIEDVYLQLNNLQKLLGALDQLKAQSAKSPTGTHSPTSPWPFINATTPIPSAFSADSERSFFPASAGLLSARDTPLSSAAPVSPALPTSPLLDMLSGSIRARRRHYAPRTPRLKDFKDKSLLAILSRATVKISTIKCAASLLPERELYETTISEITLAASPMKRLPESDFHDSILGSKRRRHDFDCESYGLNFSIYQIVVARRERLHSLRLLKLGQIALEASAIQWPSPWLKPSPFLKGDPNAPFASARFSIEDIQAADRIDHFQKLLDYLRSPKAPKERSIPRPTLDLSRVALQLHCGNISARLILIDTSVGPRALEVNTEGALVSLTSEYVNDSQRKALSPEVDQNRQQLRMILRPMIVLEPVTIHLQPAMTAAYAYSSGEPTLAPTSPVCLLFLGRFVIGGDGHLISFFNPDIDCVPSVVLSTAVLNLHLSSEKMSLELWHPDAWAVVRLVLELSTSKNDNAELAEPIQPVLPSPLVPLLDRLPAGVVTTLAFGQILIMLTAPDIFPSESSGLTRGLAVSTGVSFGFSSLHTSHTYRFSNLPNQSLLRQKLSLPEEQVAEAFSAAQASAITQRASAHARFTLSDTSIHNIIATPNGIINFQPSPRKTGSDKRIFNSKKVQVNVHLSGKRGAIASKTDACQVSISAPDNRVTWQMADVYASLLVAQSVKSLLPITKTRLESRPRKQSSPLDVQLDISIGALQVLSSLPSEKIAIRLDGISIRLQDGKATVHLPRIVAWVSMPSKVNKWDDDVGEKWEELATLGTIQTTLEMSKPKGALIVEAESAKLCIPFGYILANLIQDIGISLKGIKHLLRTTASGVYSDPPPPEAEGPKIIPHLTIKIRYLSVEAADDSLESRLGVIWRCGAEAVKHRLEREEAFLAKLEAIAHAYRGDNPPSDDDDDEESDPEFEFDAEHTVSIEDARRRLDGVHELDWTFRLRTLRNRQAEFEEATQQVLGRRASRRSADVVANIVNPSPVRLSPPLFRLALQNVNLDLQPPSFPVEDLSKFLAVNGDLPIDTEFSLLVPLNLHLTTSALHGTLRDYPLPLLNIAPNGKTKSVVFDFKTDLVIAEEMGTDASVDWKICEILKPDDGVEGASGFVFDIPKTIMPVKTYANPVINVLSDSPMIMSWGVSYTPAIQDLMKVLESLSTPPRDPSPPVGFWDKLRLILHWKVSMNFEGEVRCHLKGSRDPYKITDDGTGFVLSFGEHPQLLVNHPNESGELIQVTSGSMYIAIPNLENFHPNHYRHSFAPRANESKKAFQKVCAKLRSGVRFGIGFMLERACGIECNQCSGPAFHRKCRMFDFIPHYKVRLEKKLSEPLMKTPEDSFNGFRSDFIHLSISLQSSTSLDLPAHVKSPSNLHLTPKAFAHFWAWCSLFNGALSLPTRQGSYYPSRTISPKLGRHLATLKYRTHFPDLYVMHAYIDESRETWADGVAPWVGVKGKVQDFQVDLHQREEELTVPNLLTEGKKVVRRKSLYAAEVSLKNLDLRVLLATFDEPLKKQIEMSAPTQRCNYRSHTGLPITSPASLWFDVDDFVETGWSTSRRSVVHLLPLVTCPHFTYLNRKSSTNKNVTETSKFGLEKSHHCLLGTDQSVAQIQSDLVKARIQELKTTLETKRVPGSKRRGSGFVPAAAEKMISLLEEYGTFLESTQTNEASVDHDAAAANYLLPFDAISSDEWADFENVYQIHCPVVFMDAAIRDIILQYYYCSRARKGFEYHMATRAIKFIRDQAEMSQDEVDLHDDPVSEKGWGAGATAHMAASAFRKIWKGDNSKPSIDIVEEPEEPKEFDPLHGWTEGVSLSKSHCCLLVKPQIVLREDQNKETLVVAAVQAKLRIYAIMDDSNVDDHISGKIMSRSYTSLSGLQIFAPVGTAMLRETHVPLEVLIDLRCETTDFDRVVPQTDAKFHYDKFNRLRLRNNITSAKHNFGEKDSHLNDQTDLIRVHVPQFTVSANDENFQAISQIVTKLVLFSDVAHKTRLEKLETLLYTYDFTDLRAAANLVSDLRDQINDALETQRIAQNNSNPRLAGEEGQMELLKLQAHIFLLTEELNFIYDAIKLAQDRFDDQAEQRSALLLHASSSQISWRMLDDRKDLLAKLVVENIDFSWLSRQDSSTGNNLSVGNLQAFDGSRFAVWTEILSKHYEPANHPMLKKGLFMLASWSVLAPVGGITIYESFELTLHPIRLQIDARVGRRMMEYLWPERKRRNEITEQAPEINVLSPTSPGRTSLDSPRGLQSIKPLERVGTGTSLAPPLRRLGPSRSFTDLRNSAKDSLSPLSLGRQKSTDNMRQNSVASEFGEKGKALAKKEGDAAEMKTRASQKTFVMVKVSSLHLLLSIAKEGSFECRDAKIRTRDLEYHNQTWSFEELVNQFIPSDMSWRGWVKMAFHQPLLPVLPVARELFSKTKLLGGSKAAPEIDEKGPAPKLPRAKALSGDDNKKVGKIHSRQRSQTKSPVEGEPTSPPIPKITRLPLTDEPEGFASDTETSPSGKSFLSRRKSSRSGRLKTLLARKSPRAGSSRTSVKSPKSPPLLERPSTSSG